MKFSLAFLVALALSGAVDVFSLPVEVQPSSSELNEVLQEFLALVPRDKVIEIFYDYLENDAEFERVVHYVQSDSFRGLVKKAEALDEIVEFWKYLHESGLDIYSLVNVVHQAIGLPAYIPEVSIRAVGRTGGVAGFIADIKALLPVDKIKNLYHEKLETSPAFAALIKRIRTPRFQELVNALRANKEYQKIVDFARKAGVNLDHIKDLLTSIFGLEFPSRLTRSTHDLNDDLNDFLAILPTNEITAIALDYIDNDVEVQKVSAYLESAAFHQIVQEVEAMKEARDVLAFLEASGLDAYKFLNTIHDLLGIPQFTPTYLTSRSLTRRTGGFNGFIADIKAILPIEDIKALYYQKLEHSPAFANLIKRLSSPEFQEFVDTVLAKEEARSIIKKLKEHNVNIQAVADLLSTILGLRFPKPTLNRANDELIADLFDFLAILPFEEVLDTTIDYVFNDPEVQKAAIYVRSVEFQKLVTAAEQNKEFLAFIEYLDDSGLPAIALVNQVNGYLGIPAVNPSVPEITLRAGGGVRGMLDAIEALLPEKDIKALYEEKKKSSKAFAHLIERLEAPQFQTLVNELAGNKHFQNLGFNAARFGIDLQRIVDFFQRVFGISIPVIQHP